MPLVKHSALAAIACLIGSAARAEPIDGFFRADRACPAYVSKNKRTNPDQSGISAGQTYRVIERNAPDHPSHYRIVLDTARPRERWVGSDCGSFSPDARPAPAIAMNPPATNPPRAAGTPGPAGHCPVPAPGAGPCETCGRGDGYVLALSWQPAFCESQKDDPSAKAECRITDPNAYQARNFTLHGLWPNQTACGIHYGYCGGVREKPRAFSDYPAVPLSEATRASLAEVMPSVAVGSGLERHEWHKHGTCSGFAPDEYFGISADLARQFNRSGMADYMAARLGRTVTQREFYDAIDRTLGAGARHRVTLDCGRAGKLLQEITLTLPARIEPGADLQALLRQARPGAPRSKCGDSFVIDPIGF